MSTLGNSPRSNTVFRVEQGKSFAFGMRFLYARTKRPINLTGASTTLTVRKPKNKGGVVAFTKTGDVVQPELGLHQFRIQATDLNLPAGDYPFDLSMTSSIGYVTLVAKGVFSVQGNANNGGLGGGIPMINPGTNLAVYVEHGNVLNVIVDNVDGLSVVLTEITNDYTATLQSLADESEANAATASSAAAVATTKAAAASSSAAAVTTAANTASTAASLASTKAGEAAASAVTAVNANNSAYGYATAAGASAAAAAASAEDAVVDLSGKLDIDFEKTTGGIRTLTLLIPSLDGESYLQLSDDGDGLLLNGRPVSIQPYADFKPVYLTDDGQYDQVPARLVVRDSVTDDVFNIQVDDGVFTVNTRVVSVQPNEDYVPLYRTDDGHNDQALTAVDYLDEGTGLPVSTRIQEGVFTVAGVPLTGGSSLPEGSYYMEFADDYFPTSQAPYAYNILDGNDGETVRNITFSDGVLRVDNVAVGPAPDVIAAINDRLDALEAGTGFAPEMEARLLPTDGAQDMMLLRDTSGDNIAVWENQPPLGMYRGTWASDTEYFFDDFNDNTFSPFTTAAEGSGTVTSTSVVGMASHAGASKPGNTNLGQVVGTTGNVGNGFYIQLDLALIPALAGMTPTKVTFWESMSVSSITNKTFEFFEGSTFKKSLGISTAGAWTAWEQHTVTLGGSLSQLRWKARPSGSSSGGFTMSITGISVRANLQPYMRNEVVDHLGSFYRSEINNNPNTPGADSSWTLIVV